jgi:hypothetical protein
MDNMEYTKQDVSAAFSPDMLALTAKFDEWFEAEALRVGEGNIYKTRAAFFEIAQLVYGIGEVQFERALDIRLTEKIKTLKGDIENLAR